MGFDRMAVCVLAIGCWVTLVEDSSIALLLISGCSLKPPGMSSTDPRTTSCKSISARDSRFSDRRTRVGLAGSLEPLPVQFICHGTRRRVRDVCGPDRSLTLFGVGGVEHARLHALAN